MNLQDLTHRLVVATEEQDVLYVLFWLQEMKQENCLEEAINSKRCTCETDAMLCPIHRKVESDVVG